MRWIDTEWPDEASLQSGSFWANHRDTLQDHEFWADKIKGLKDDPVARLELALDNLPLPAAFREAVVALRALIRIERKEGSEWQSHLKQIYKLAAYESLMLDYAPRLQQPGYNVMESIPGKVVTGLDFSYETLGYRDLRLLNKTDTKGLVEMWGEPARHTTLNALHKSTWDRFEDALIRRQRVDSDRLLADLVALRTKPTPPPIPKATMSAPPPLPPNKNTQMVVSAPPTLLCRFCHGPITAGVQKCRHCGEFLTAAAQSNGTAGCLGLLLGPVGLWYKGQWAAGFAWIVITILIMLGTGGVGIVLAPFFWIGMAVHAYSAPTKR